MGNEDRECRKVDTEGRERMAGPRRRRELSERRWGGRGRRGPTWAQGTRISVPLLTSLQSKVSACVMSRETGEWEAEREGERGRRLGRPWLPLQAAITHRCNYISGWGTAECVGGWGWFVGVVCVYCKQPAQCSSLLRPLFRQKSCVRAHWVGSHGESLCTPWRHTAAFLAAVSVPYWWEWYHWLQYTM